MTAPVPEQFDSSAFKFKAPEPNAKSGGVLRHGMPLRAPHGGKLGQLMSQVLTPGDEDIE